MYEYRIETIRDNQYGSTDLILLDKTVQNYAKDNWRLHSVFTNEVGKTGSSVSVGGFTSATNATIDEVVLIFEREIIDRRPRIEAVTPEVGKKITEYYSTIYNPEIPFRAMRIFVNDNDSFGLRYYGYGEKPYEAIEFTLEVMTKFGDIKSFESIFVGFIEASGHNCETEQVSIEGFASILPIIREISIRISRYADCKSVYSVSTPYISVPEETEEILKLQGLYGKDVVQEAIEDENGWYCICGKHNKLLIKQCAICGRTRMKGQTIYDTLLMEIESDSLLTAKDVSDYISGNEKYNELPDKLWEIISDTVRVEQSYGNKKNWLISRIKDYISELD